MHYFFFNSDIGRCTANDTCVEEANCTQVNWVYFTCSGKFDLDQHVQHFKGFSFWAATPYGRVVYVNTTYG